ncbi:M4 family metallopeptidase, partial [Streptomyces sp. 549]|uniref:M4 family metallopeptidase n=1 Tax=Streptomyces sp. 549 TaxID=3049076 RepID=UPI0024C43D3C
MLAVGVQASASADPRGDRTPSADVARPGALAVDLAPAERTALLRGAQAQAAEAARELDLGSKEKLVVRDVVANADGSTHTRYERTFAGLPVLGGDLVVHRSSSGVVKRVSRSSEAVVEVASLEAPVGKKPKSVSGSGSVAPRKVVWAGDGGAVLAWERVVGGTQEDGTPSELHQVFDAATGAKLYEYQAVHNGTGHSQYSGRVQLGTSGSGSSFTLTDAARGNHRTYNLNRGTSGTGTLFSDADDVWGDGTPANAQTAGVDAHYGAGVTWDYFKEVHGRNGVRGDGVAPYSRVHYGNNYVNAFWSDSCFCMTYGDGANNQKPLTSMDVAAHEMTHGLTSNTAKLVYAGESGGLNEATSDIFAAAVEFHANNPADPADYLVGEKIDIRGDGTPLRYMDRPSRDGKSKDAWYSGIGSIDVHYSSGPANHFFYLLSEGSGQKTINGVAYDSPTSDNLPVTGIGINKAERIWFKALTEQMTSRSDYADARRTTLIAAAALHGENSTEHRAVASAWAAVNVGARPGDPGEPGGGEYENTDDLAIPDNGPAV